MAARPKSPVKVKSDRKSDRKSMKRGGAAVAAADVEDADETNSYFNKIMEYAPNDEIPSIVSDEITQNKNKNILSIILQLLRLQWAKQTKVESEHENLVQQLLKDNGISEWKTDQVDKTKQILLRSEIKFTTWIHNIIDNPRDETGLLMPEYSYLFQPCGTHGNPDFIIKFGPKQIIGLECKSTTDSTSPMYNSGGVKQNYIYVFTSKKTGTVLYMGSSIITPEQQLLINELIEEQRKLQDRYNKKLREIDSNHRGISYYTRPMIIQSGDASYTNYFTHQNRNKAFYDVIVFIQGIYNI
jgi:hypothetical protein